MTTTWGNHSNRTSIKWVAVLSNLGALAVSVGILFLSFEFFFRWKPWVWVWSDLVWLWNSGPKGSPWVGPARWLLVGVIVAALYLCFLQFLAWWKRRR